jgi:uncharacterized protein
VAKTQARALALFLLWAILCSHPALSQDIPPSPERWATDRTGFLSPGTVAELDALLEAFERRTGHQVILFVDKTTGIVPIEDWAVRAFEEWGVGRRGKDDGLALFIMSEDRRMRIEVGYGLEGVVPDAAASRVISEILVPRFQEGDPDTGVREAVGRLLEIIEGEPGAEDYAEQDRDKDEDSPSIVDIIIFGFLGLLFLYILITNPALAVRMLFVIMSGGGGGRGGGSFGGGGFSGGGGRSGGGGASGSW